MESSYRKNNPHLRQPKMQHMRHLKPEFYVHEGVNDMSVNARYAETGTWTCCDKFGRFEWKPRMLKRLVMPYDDVNFESLMNEWIEHGFAEKYEINGEMYGRFLNWEKHQGINRREIDSKFEHPAPPHSASTISAYADTGLHVQARVVSQGKGKRKRQGETNQTPIGGLVQSVCDSQTVTPESKDGFRKAQKVFRQIVGKGLGSLSSRGEEWSGLVKTAGIDLVLAAIAIWSRENQEFLGTAGCPLGHFLKNSNEYIEAAKMAGASEVERDETANMPTVEDIRPPGYVPPWAKRAVI